MMRILVFLKKEFLLLSRDLHALLLLFLMPTLFILIMSLAMQDTFSTHSRVQIDYLVLNDDTGEQGRVLAEALAAGEFFSQVPAVADQTEAPITPANAPQNTPPRITLEALLKITRSDKIKFLLHIPDNFSASIGTGVVQTPVRIYTAPGAQAPVAQLFEAKVRELTGSRFMHQLGAPTDAMDSLGKLVKSQSADPDGGAVLPTSVQQNVPAWLVFSMFFIAIPVSTTLLGEKSHGTLDRLATMNVSRLQFLLSKLLTYMLINLVQAVLMIMVGIWIVPLLGGDALTLGQSPFALLLVALATSFAAVSFALLIANVAQTTEQATIFAGVSNIVLAAIGGVMVPRFVMPSAMQSFSQFSPHAWGLEGFLDVILRGGGVADVLPEVSYLVIFACIMMTIAIRLLMHD